MVKLNGRTHVFTRPSKSNFWAEAKRKQFWALGFLGPREPRARAKSSEGRAGSRDLGPHLLFFARVFEKGLLVKVSKNLFEDFAKAFE